MKSKQPPISLQQKLKSVARHLFPGVYVRLSSSRSHYAALTRKIIEMQGPIVAGGPFRGLKYTRSGLSGRVIPKLIGSYEAELHPHLAKLMARPWKSVINIGCAEGYYAVGWATVVRDSKVLAFDSDPNAQRLCKDMATLNGVEERLTVQASCAVDDLLQLPLAGSAIVMDCEGCELDLLTPEVISRLGTSSLLVELHDCFRPGLTAMLAARFRRTHRFRTISSCLRELEDYSVLSGLSEEDAKTALNEGRVIDGVPVEQQWAIITPLQEQE